MGIDKVVISFDNIFQLKNLKIVSDLLYNNVKFLKKII